MRIVSLLRLLPPIAIGLSASAPAQVSVPTPQFVPTPSHPKVSWESRCGGVDPVLLAARRKAALARALAGGATAATFAANERSCPRRDLAYYDAILASGGTR